MHIRITGSSGVWTQGCLLSVQCLDSVALRAAKQLIKAAPAGATEVLALGEDGLARHLSSLNYCRSKVKYVLGCTRAVVEDYGGVVPDAYKNLLALPGVGPKVVMWFLDFALVHNTSIQQCFSCLLCTCLTTYS